MPENIKWRSLKWFRFHNSGRKVFQEILQGRIITCILFIIRMMNIDKAIEDLNYIIRTNFKSQKDMDDYEDNYIQVWN